MSLEQMASSSARANRILGEVLFEVESSIVKHGEQNERPLGLGPYSYPLSVVNSEVTMCSRADWLETVFKADTDSAAAAGTLTWWQILREEVFEAAAAATPEEQRAELLQVAAMAVKSVMVLDHQMAMAPETVVMT